MKQYSFFSEVVFVPGLAAMIGFPALLLLNGVGWLSQDHIVGGFSGIGIGVVCLIFSMWLKEKIT